MLKKVKKNIIKLFINFYYYNFVPVFIMLLVVCIFLIGILTYKFHLSFTYTESGSSDYNVILNNNDFFDSNILPSNMEYIEKLISNINSIFKYQIKSDHILNLRYKYNINTKLILYDSKNNKVIKEIEEKVFTENKSSKSNNLTINKNIKVDLSKYKKLINELSQKTSKKMHAKLIVYMNLIVKGNNSSFLNDIFKKRNLKLVIPLNNGIIKIDKNSIKKEENIIEENSVVKRVLLYILFMISIIIFAVVIILFFNNYEIYKNKKKYYKTLKNIFESNNKIINSNYRIKVSCFKKRIDVLSFEKLSFISSSLNLPIIYYEDKKLNSNFYVMENDNVYRFILKNKAF